MRKIFAGVMLAVLLCGSAGADVVYTTDTGNVGLIKILSSTSADFYGTQYTGVGSDSLLGSYWDGSSSSSTGTALQHQAIRRISSALQTSRSRFRLRVKF